MSQIQIINQFPTFPQIPSHHYNNRNMSMGDFSYHSESTTKLNYPPKKPLSGGEEISNGDLTIPPNLTKIQKSKLKTLQKINPYHSLQVIGEKFG